ncbi:hypothetical protein DH86_00000202, partial [Scytalidium sp. 3C]
LESSQNSNTTISQRSNAESASLRLAYFGLCLEQGSETTCLSTSGSSAKDVSNSLNGSTGGHGIPASIESMLEPALALQSQVFTCMIGVAAIIFCAGLISLAILHFSLRRTKAMDFKPINIIRRQNALRQASLAFTWIATGFAFAGTYAMMKSLDAIKVQTKYWVEDADITAGTAILVFHWFTFTCIFLFTAGISIIHRSRSSDFQESKEGLPYPAA